MPTRSRSTSRIADPMAEQSWQPVAVPANEAAARILLGLLESESIPARIKSNEPEPGLGISFRVEVPATDVERALELLGSSQVSDEELAALALSTREPDPG
jgi:hypothetical protein